MTQRQRRARPLKDRLMAKTSIEPNGCWLWLGYRMPFGHGQIGLGRKLILTHRASWIIYRGEIPEGMCVCHKCDVPNCINPDHLFLGTKHENNTDMKAKGRAKNHNTGRNHCKRGHEMSTINTYVRPDGNRQCKECRKDIMRKYDNKRRDKKHEQRQKLNAD